MKRFALALLVVLALAGCTQAEPSSVENFKGAEAEVAQKIEDLETAGKASKPTTSARTSSPRSSSTS